MNDLSASPALSQGDWNPALYLKFEGERARAARDLLAQVPLDAPAFGYDLGCGPGNSTELLRHRFPRAALVGLDTSEAMLAHARGRVPDARFVRESVDDFRPSDTPQRTGLCSGPAACHRREKGRKPVRLAVGPARP